MHQFQPTHPDGDDQETKICVVGIGGGGCNALDMMIRSRSIEGVQFIACNTDLQSLKKSLAPIKIQLGRRIVSGKGSGADPEIGARAAVESLDEVAKHLEGFDMVFITVGMGGGTGTGAAPIIADKARSMGILTVSIVTTPFDFEGTRREAQAQKGIFSLRSVSDTLIVVANSNLRRQWPNLTLIEGFEKADSVLLDTIKGISQLVLNVGYINVDFADVRAVMEGKMQSRAVIGMGRGKGENAVIDAVTSAIHSPMLDNSAIDDAQGVLYTITCGQLLTIEQLSAGADLIKKTAHRDATIIFGATIDPELQGGEVLATIVATGMPMDMTTPEPIAEPSLSLTPVVDALPGMCIDLAHKRIQPPRRSLPPINSASVPSRFFEERTMENDFSNEPCAFDDPDDFLHTDEDGAMCFDLLDQETNEAMKRLYPNGYTTSDIPTFLRKGNSMAPTPANRPMRLDANDPETPAFFRKGLKPTD